MRRSWWTFGAVSAVALLASIQPQVVPSTQAAPPAEPVTAAGPTATPQAAAVGITLITGDQVTYRTTSTGTPIDADVQAARRTDGRQVLFTQVRDGDRYYVYPSDVAGLIDSGRLDRRLFEVSYLAKAGFTDDKAKSLGLIIEYPGGAGLAAADSLPATTEYRPLASAQAAAVEVSKAQTADFWRVASTQQTKIWLDGKVEADLDVSVPQIGAPAAWQAGYTGKGVKVAVLDTGADLNHPDLAGKIMASRSFVAGQEVQDGNGHGTHVADTIVGSGAASGGKYRGVAPEAELLVGKVLSDAGSGADSEVIAGMEWAAAQGADVISMSLGGCCTDGTDPLSQAVNRLSAQYGTLFVIAAGNSSYPLTVGSPGVADAALTVAAVDGQDQRASFSSQGPRAGDYALKPDLAAPGVGIVAARAAGTSLGTPVDEYYTSASGTSMATPHVAGAAAILAQRRPSWSGEQLKAALIGSATPTSDSAYEVGSGRVDVRRAIGQQVTSSGNVDLTKQQAVTYTNHTDRAVTLRLSGGQSLQVPSVITVPAGGAKTVQPVLRKPVPGSWFQGTIVATGNGIRLTNAVGGYTPPEQHPLAANIVLPEGATGVEYLPWYLLRLDDANDLDLGDNVLFGPPGVTLEGTVAGGTYSVQTAIRWRDAAGEPQVTLLSDPQVRIDGSTKVTLDARKATRTNASTPRPAVEDETRVGYLQTTVGGRRSYQISAASLPGQQWGLWAAPTEKVTVGTFQWKDERLLVAPGGGQTPYVYSLTYPVTGRIPAQLAKRVTDKDVYRYDSRYHADAPGNLSLSWSSFAKPGRGLGSTSLTLRAPATLTEYVGPLQPGVLRSRAAALSYDGTPGMTGFERNGWIQGRQDVITRPGARTDTFGAQPLVHATLGDVPPEWNDYFWQLCTACRSGSIFMPWHITDSTGLGSGIQTYYPRSLLGNQPQTQLRLWGPDGQEIGVQEGSWQFSFIVLRVPYFVLPDEPGRYRLTETFPTPFKPQKWARTVESEWTFVSGKPESGYPYRPPLGIGVHCATWDTTTALGKPDTGSCEPNSQLYLGYDLGLALDNTSPGGRSHQIRINGYHHSYLTSDPELRSLKLSVSYDDGLTWKAAPTRKDARSSFTATLQHPQSGAVSLRAEGVDAAGNTIKQTIHRAYGLTGP